MVYFCKFYRTHASTHAKFEKIFRMVIEAFVYLQKRIKEEDEIRHKFDGSNILKRKDRAPRNTNGPFFPWIRMLRRTHQEPKF